MDKKRISMFILIIVICFVTLIIIFGKLAEYKKGHKYDNMPFSDVANSLSDDEKQKLKAIKNGDTSVEMPKVVKDIITSPSLEKGLDKLYNR